MDYKIDNINLLDDGSLDTLIQVNGEIGTREYRYNIETENNNQRIEIAFDLAKEDYQNEI